MSVSTNGPVRIVTDAQLIATVPYLLPFTPGAPQGDVVLLGSRSIAAGVSRIAVTMRANYPSGSAADASADLIGQLVSVCQRNQVDSAVIILVKAGLLSESDAHGQRTHDVGAALSWALEGASVSVDRVMAVEVFSKGESWLDVLSGQRGLQEDPCCTELAASRTLAGQRRARDRSEVVQMYERRERLLSEEPVAELLLDLRVHIREGGTAAVKKIARSLTGMGLATDKDCEHLWNWRAAALLVDPVYSALITSTCALNSSDGEMRAAEPFAESETSDFIYEQLALRAPAQSRSRALTIVGLRRYFLGDGVHAAAAFDKARQEDPTNRMAVLGAIAVETGTPPEDFRRSSISAA